VCSGQHEGQAVWLSDVSCLFKSVGRLSGLAVGRRERGGFADGCQMYRNGPAMSCVRVFCVRVCMCVCVCVRSPSFYLSVCVGVCVGGGVGGGVCFPVRVPSLASLALPIY